MKRIFIPTTGPCQWRSFLGDPKKHWKRGRSALETAMSWESAQCDPYGRGLPAEVADLFDRTPLLVNASLIIAIPEHQVRLDTAKAPSQNDLWALLRNDCGLISLSVEAKAGEPFGEIVDQWLNQNSKKDGRDEWITRDHFWNDLCPGADPEQLFGRIRKSATTELNTKKVVDLLKAHFARPATKEGEPKQS